MFLAQMGTLFESPISPTVAVLYKECKGECKFAEKSDSDFLLFLLNSAVRILNVGELSFKIIEYIHNS